MKTQKIIICIVLILGCSLQTTGVKAQQDKIEIITPVYLNGPRIGFTYINEGEFADFLKSELDLNPFITQLGW